MLFVLFLPDVLFIIFVLLLFVLLFELEFEFKFFIIKIIIMINSTKESIINSHVYDLLL